MEVWLTSWRLSFLDLSSNRKFNSRSPLGGVICISLLFISTSGTMASTKGTKTSWPETSVPADFDFPLLSSVSKDESSTICSRSLAPLLKTFTTVPTSVPFSWEEQAWSTTPSKIAFRIKKTHYKVTKILE